MHTWALVCSLMLTPAQCNLETADRWFQVAPRTIDIRAAIMRSGIFNRKTQFIKIFKYGESLGTDSYIYYPCDRSLFDIKKTIDEGERQDLRQDLHKQLSKGACLR